MISKTVFTKIIDGKKYCVREAQMSLKIDKDTYDVLLKSKAEQLWVKKFFIRELINIFLIDVLISYIFFKEFFDLFSKNEFLFTATLSMIIGSGLVVVLGRQKFLRDCHILNLNIDENFNTTNTTDLNKLIFDMINEELKEDGATFSNIFKFNMNINPITKFIDVICYYKVVLDETS